jgi:hypothetical protein
MFKNRFIKFAVSFFLILLALWIATPKVYIHNLLDHHHTEITTGSETTVKTQSADECEFDKYNKPVYFSIFRFICSFIPLKSPGAGKLPEGRMFLVKLSFAVSQLRGPPTN